MKHIGVSKTVPISTGLQLAGNALAGVLIWHEWTSGNMIMVGTIAVIALIVGAALTSLKIRAIPRRKTMTKICQPEFKR